MISTQTPMGLSAFVVELCSVTAPTSLLGLHGTAVSAAARARVAGVSTAAFGADLPGPPRGAPV